MYKIKIGLLLLYMKHYDRVFPNLRFKFEPLVQEIKYKFESEGFSIKISPICMEEDEFRKAIREFEKNHINVIITLHLAYSPSLEVISSLVETKIPILVMNTTFKYDFSANLISEDIMQNSGIHGVQDMCNMMVRKNKQFLIESGHIKDGAYFKKIINKVKALAILSNLRNCRAGIIGGHFKGMGDSIIPHTLLKKDLGIDIIEAHPNEILKISENIKEYDLNKELDKDKFNYEFKNITKDALITTNLVGLGLRRWLDVNNIDAFTINFFNFIENLDFPTFPFMEISKAMARGIGYAGEGDILTASILGAILKIIPHATFTEMYCPDWKNNLILLSHMGEINEDIISGKPILIEEKLSYSKMRNPVIITGQYKEGLGTLVSLSRSRNGYSLLLCETEIISFKDKLSNSIRGWSRIKGNLGDFLSRYNTCGGSHHLILIYGNNLEMLINFGKIAGFNTVVLT